MTPIEKFKDTNIAVLEKISGTSIKDEDFLKNLLKWFIFREEKNDGFDNECNECDNCDNLPDKENSEKALDEECSEDEIPLDEDIYAEWIMKKPFGKLPDQMLYPTVTKRLEEFSNALDQSDPDKWFSLTIEEYKQILKDHDDGKITLNPKELEYVNRILLDLKSMFEKKTSDNDKDVPKFSGRTIPSLKVLKTLKSNGIDNDFLERYKDNVLLAIELANEYGADSSEMKCLWNVWKEKKQEVLVSMGVEELEKEKEKKDTRANG